MLAGPTEAEAAEGYGGWFSEETGVFYVDFADFSSVIPNASTSCGSAALLAQLNSTLEQYPDVGEPRYSFDGDVAAFYESQRLPRACCFRSRASNRAHEVADPEVTGAVARDELGEHGA